MPKLESALKHLCEGCFICEMRYPDEYEALLDPEGRKRADEWLSMIGYRLARLTDEGAFFMAHAVVTNDMRARFREEMKNVRTKLEPMVTFLETIRQAQGRNPQIHSGDMLWESEISEAVRGSSLLERRLTEMRGDITGARISDSSIDRVRRVLAQMESEGYIVETNPASKGYKVTGKIDYLYQLIAFIAENTALLSDDNVVDQVDAQLRLDGASPADAHIANPGEPASADTGTPGSEEA